MDYIENSNTQYSVSKFTKKFITNYIIGAILIGVVVYIISEVLSSFLPTYVQLIVNFLLTIFGFWKISSSAIETSLKEATITQENVRNVLRNIFIFLIILLVINVLFTYIQFHFSVKVLSSLKNALIINLIAKIIATIIQYGIIMMFCKNKLEEKVLGKEINKILYIVLLIVAIVVLCGISFFNKNGSEAEKAVNSTSISGSEAEKTVNSTSISGSEIASKYKNAKWEEIYCSSSTNVDTNIATVYVSLGHLEENTVKKYKAVKIVCTIYKQSTNKVIGESENYYEDVELSYGFLSFSEIISVKLSTSFVGNDFSSTVKAYGVKY